ncbi:MAG: beta-lactamase family protein [Bacteroidales bacterium]|nr:beta-lactamase family protein [Bacteroidales bacterium]
MLTLAVLAAVAITSSGKKDQEIRRVPVNLNETLTNAVSDTSVLDGFDKIVKDYMTYWGLHGVSLSVMRNDSLLFAKGFGMADTNVPMEPGHVLRMASVSKLVTAVGIMVLEEKGLLTLEDKVFGPDGILNDSIFNAAIKDTLYHKITVEDLLRHKGGFSKKGGDPMFSTRWIMIQNRWSEVPTKEQLTVVQLKRPLAFEPGTWQDYSNYGYLALSMVIEKLSGLPYEVFIQENVLHPAGCVNFKIGGNYYVDKYPDEVRYYVQKDDEPVEEFNNSGRKVIRSYGGNNVSGLLGAGAWVGSTPELALLVASIDGRPEVPDIITEESVRAMTEYIDPDTFSLGWNDTKPDGEWTRTGTFAGTSALVKYFPDGECWVFITNTSTYRGPGLARFTTELFEKLRASYSSKFPPRNLFYAEE